MLIQDYFKKKVDEPNFISRRKQGMRKIKKTGKECKIEHMTDGKISENQGGNVSKIPVYPFDSTIQNQGMNLGGAVEDQRQILSRLYNLAPVSFFILDILGVIEQVNDTGSELFGYSKIGMQNKRFQHFILPEYLEDFNLFLQNMRECSSKKSIEIRLGLANEKEIYAHLEGIVVRSSPSKIQYYLAAIDITINREAEVKLKEVKNMLEMTLRASATGTWSVQNEKNNVFFDEYSHEILELAPSSFQGTLEDSMKYIHPKERIKVLKAVSNAITTSSAIDLEFQIITAKGNKKDIHSKGRHISLSPNKVLFAGIMMDITAQKNLLRRADTIKKNQEKQLLAATLAAQESERNNISRALHDSVCQLLYGIKLNFQCLPLPIDLTRELSQINTLLDQAIKETRNLSYTLTPSVLNDFGFVAGIKEMSQRLSTATFTINCFVNSAMDQLEPLTQLYLFRIIQELVNNCIKHASASKVLIVAKEEVEKIKVIVSDNGKGFPADPLETFKNGSGLRSIRNQVFLLNGELTFKSGKNRTTICLTFNRNTNF